jgi:hypothetical protein
MDSKNYSWWLATSSGSFMCLAVSAPPVGRYFVLKASHLALAFLLPSQGEKCQQRDIVEIEPETRIIRHELAWHRHAKYVGSYVNL